ncbi:transcription initiation factor TFIID component TAF4 family-domain-containing protein [Roridomyces roridus]|uniref:Transcription initiation factor TFIID subunit 4 n=1 Tax=Roridomyces roridus TaxID=1738132 RepID=A0AAD7B6A3_9AGAR|nr:transcription initiation factor TFIID component TAF4 family-domain-containing protein [Roridomyces roridus]
MDIPIDPALQGGAATYHAYQLDSDEAPPDSRPRLDRSLNQPLNPNFDLTVINPRLKAIAEHHGLPGGVPHEAASYIAFALRTRLETLVKQMAVAAHHRTDTQFDRPALYEPGAPMWGLAVRSDVTKQVAALERVEREDETRIRRERKERAEMTAAHVAAMTAQNGGVPGGGMEGFEDDEGGKRKKKKVDGPGVTARNMSEDVRKKMSNAVASQAAGIGGKYSWMTAGNAAAAAAKPSKATSTPSTPAATASTGGGWARAHVGKKGAAAAAAPPPPEEDMRTAITIRDAHFVVEKERSYGGGRGSGKGWT